MNAELFSRQHFQFLFRPINRKSILACPGGRIFLACPLLDRALLDAAPTAYLSSPRASAARRALSFTSFLLMYPMIPQSSSAGKARHWAHAINRQHQAQPGLWCQRPQRPVRSMERRQHSCGRPRQSNRHSLRKLTAFCR